MEWCLYSNVDAIQEYPRPTDMRSLQFFLGLVNFYRRFVPVAAKILRPLTDALRSSGNSRLSWTTGMEAAFLKAKQAVCRAASLAHPDPAAPLSLAVDASDSHVGGVLQQLTANGLQPLSFFSAKLSPAKKKYSAFGRELLYAISASCLRPENSIS